MRRIIKFDSIKNNRNFWLYFFGSNFPEALDSDLTLSEMILANYMFSKEWVDEFTSYYDGVFEEYDGYVDNPNTLTVRLNEDTDLFIEFHPGDRIYFINNTEIGCTGPDYIIHKISWKEFNLIGEVPHFLSGGWTCLFQQEYKLLLKCHEVAMRL